MIIVYYVIKFLIWLIGFLPVRWAAYLGRFIGAIVYVVDGRHRKVAQDNLRLVFGKELSEEKIRALAKENYKRVVEAYFSAIRTLLISPEEVQQYLKIFGAEKMRPKDDPEYGPSRVALIGHFGNFEAYAKVSALFPWLRFATTYRGFDVPQGERLLKELRSRSDCLFFERRRDGQKLREAMSHQSLLIGLLADQSPGNHGIWLPFMGVECFCSTSPAVFALRYNCPIIPVFCYRVAPGRWKIQFEDEIATKVKGKPRSVRDIMIDVNAAYESAIRRDPANWFWVHRRWKTHFEHPELIQNKTR